MPGTFNWGHFWVPGNVNVIVKQSVGHFSFNYWRGFMYDDDKVRHFTSSEVFNFCSPGTFHLFIFIFIFKRENIASAKHIQYYAPLQNAIFLVLLCARGLAAPWFSGFNRCACLINPALCRVVYFNLKLHTAYPCHQPRYRPTMNIE